MFKLPQRKNVLLTSGKKTTDNNKTASLKTVSISSKKSTDKKAINLVAQLPSNKSQNYRKASLIVVAKAPDKAVRSSKKLKRT